MKILENVKTIDSLGRIVIKYQNKYICHDCIANIKKL